MNGSIGGTTGRAVRGMITLLFTLLLAPPLLGIALGISQWVGGAFERPEMLGHRGVEAAMATAVWSIAIGAASSWWGVPAGRRLSRRRRPIEALLWTAPILLAPAVLFDAWWLELGPDTSIGAWAARHDHVPWLRRSVLAVGLFTYALPLAVWIHAAAGPDPSRDLRMLDRPRGWRRLHAWLRLDVAEQARVALLVAIVIGGLTVPFDLAQVHSIGFELRTLDTRGGSMGTLLLAGWWSVPLAVMGSILLIRGRRPERRPSADRQPEIDPEGRWIVIIGALLVTTPFVLLVRRSLQVDASDAWALHAEAAWGTLRMAILGAGGGAFVAGACGWLRAGGGRQARLASMLLAGCSIVAFMPGTLVASGVELVWNRPWTSVVYDGPAAMMLAVLGRIAIVPAVLGFMVVPRAGEVGGGSLAADAPHRFRDLVKAVGPTLSRGMIGGALAGGVLAAGEIPITARLQPPGFPLLSTSLLNAMHYQYVDSVLPVVLPVSIAAIPVAMILVALTRTRNISGIAPILVLLAVLLVPGCSPADEAADTDGATPALAPRTIFGRAGNLDGRFDYPRAVAIDADRDRLYVVDKSARIQRFSLDGEFQLAWSMPRFENGKPTGISIAPDGRVVVADTHEHRIVIFSAEGELLETHGRMGREPGEFIYPTDVVAGPEGRWFVSEYGGNDRVQVFDDDWTPISVIGFAGEVDESDRPALSRPQSIAWDARRGELFIADAIHHRIVVTDADGVLRRVLGGPGVEPGRFSYPYGLGILEDDSLLVIEFGANRVQRIHAEDGRCLAIEGGTGVEPGRLRYPWAIDVTNGVMAVLDSGNSRVLIGDPPVIRRTWSAASDPPALSNPHPNAQERSEP